MKLLVVGSDQVWSIEKVYINYLAQWGAEVQLFAAQNEFYDYYNRSIVNKVLYRAGLTRIISRINQRLRLAITQWRPDAILIFKGMEVLPSTLQWIREQGIFLANYNPDNPFVFSGAGSGNSRVTAGIPLYDLHLTYNLEIKERLDREYHIATALLPFGFDVAQELYERCLREPEISRVCFLGNPDEGRVDLIRQLLDRGIGIDVYGHHWDKFLHHDNLHIHEAVYGEDFWLVLHRYRVQLNLLRPHNLRSHNMRTFEIPGIGGIQLAPDTPEHRKFFRPDHEIFLFRDMNECYDKIKMLLDLPAAEATALREAARAVSIAAGYTYKDRARQALDSIRERMQITSAAASKATSAATSTAASGKEVGHV
jgi:spore maturation protein CgeB